MPILSASLNPLLRGVALTILLCPTVWSAWADTSLLKQNLGQYYGYYAFGKSILCLEDKITDVPQNIIYQSAQTHLAQSGMSEILGIVQTSEKRILGLNRETFYRTSLQISSAIDEQPLQLSVTATTFSFLLTKVKRLRLEFAHHSILLNAPPSATQILEFEYDWFCNLSKASFKKFSWNSNRLPKVSERVILSSSGRIEKNTPINPPVQSLSEIYSNPENIKLTGLSVSELSREAQRSDRQLVAILDTGVDYNHPKLAYKIARKPEVGIDFEDNDNLPFDFSWQNENRDQDFYSENNDHGTHVAGIAADAPEIAILPIRKSENASAQDFIKAIQYISKRGSKVVNLSFSFKNRDGAFEGLYQAMKNHPHILFIASAGNDGRKLTEDFKVFPAAIQLPNLYVVTASNSMGSLCPFSNYSNIYVNIAAIGCDILSTVPGGGMAIKSGTSMSAPLVSRVAARIFYRAPYLTPSEVIKIIDHSADTQWNYSFSVKGARVVNEARAIEMASQLNGG